MIRTTKTKRTINSMDLRKLCIEQQYYTRGDNEAYEKLLTYVQNNEDINDSAVIAIADNIFDHSDIDRIMKEYNCNEDEVFDSIYFNVGQLVNWFCTSKVILRGI